jgi:hypothetical protein
VITVLTKTYPIACAQIVQLIVLFSLEHFGVDEREANGRIGQYELTDRIAASRAVFKVHKQVKNVEALARYITHDKVL